jgi:hypothetical protein
MTILLDRAPPEKIGLVVSDPAQVILESGPYRRLACTWHTFAPEWAAQVGMDAAPAATWRAEPRSKVAFDIEDVGNGVVRLSVTHDGFAPGSSRPPQHLARLACRPAQPEDPPRDRAGIAYRVEGGGGGAGPQRSARSVRTISSLVSGNGITVDREDLAARILGLVARPLCEVKNRCAAPERTPRSERGQRAAVSSSRRSQSGSRSRVER